MKKIKHSLRKWLKACGFAVSGSSLTVVLLVLVSFPNIPLFLEKGVTSAEDGVDPDDPVVVEIADYVMLNHLVPEDYVSYAVPWCSDYEAWGNIHYLGSPSEAAWAGCGDCAVRAALLASVTKRLESLGYVPKAASLEYQPFHVYTSREAGDGVVVNMSRIPDNETLSVDVPSTLAVMQIVTPSGPTVLFVAGFLLIWLTVSVKVLDTLWGGGAECP